MAAFSYKWRLMVNVKKTNVICFIKMIVKDDDKISYWAVYLLMVLILVLLLVYVGPRATGLFHYMGDMTF
jgi:purine-cytosine permease-like protein